MSLAGQEGGTGIGRLQDWVDSVEKRSRGLAALLRGVLMVDNEGGQIVFVWCSNWHRDEGSRREPEIREHLGSFGSLPIVHQSVYDVAKEDSMLEVALELGAKVKFLEEEA